MRKMIWLVLLVVFLSGCATYKFQRGKEPYNKGYAVSRDDYIIPEYTTGKDNSMPNLDIAKERFKKRKATVEHYYKKMGYIENKFKSNFWDPPVLFLKFIGGVFRLPSIAISDYKYEHNMKYRDRIRKLEEEKDLREESRIQKLKDELNVYIQQDIASKERITPVELAKEELKPKPEAVTETLNRIEQEAIKITTQEKEESVEPQPTPQGELVQPPLPQVELAQPTPSLISEQPKAIIIAKPTKGFSPLKVHFYGYKSYAPKAKIVSYLWDFGDGDTSSTKVNPINTYWSGSFLPQYFTVTLTVQDDKGNIAKATTTIEVLHK